MNEPSRAQRIAALRPHLNAGWQAVCAQGIAHRQNICDWFENNIALVNRHPNRFTLETVNDLAHDLRQGKYALMHGGQQRLLKPDGTGVHPRGKGYWELL